MQTEQYLGIPLLLKPTKNMAPISEVDLDCLQICKHENCKSRGANNPKLKPEMRNLKNKRKGETRITTAHG